MDIQPQRSMILGNTGCNEFSGSFVAKGTLIDSIGSFTITRKFCSGSIESTFIKALSNSNRYSLDKTILRFYNDSTEVIQLKKVD